MLWPGCPGSAAGARPAHPAVGLRPVAGESCPPILSCPWGFQGEVPRPCVSGGEQGLCQDGWDIGGGKGEGQAPVCGEKPGSGPLREPTTRRARPEALAAAGAPSYLSLPKCPHVSPGLTDPSLTCLPYHPESRGAGPHVVLRSPHWMPRSPLGSEGRRSPQQD